MSEAGDILRFVACCLALAGTFSNLVVISNAQPVDKQLPWKTRFVAVHKQHPRAHSLAIVCLTVGLICLVVSFPLTFG